MQIMSGLISAALFQEYAQINMGKIETGSQLMLAP